MVAKLGGGALSLHDAWNSGSPLAIALPQGGRRILAGLLIATGGVAFADVGWSWWGNTRHPFHFVSGPQVFGRGPWYVGVATIGQLADDDPMMEELRAWELAETTRTPHPRASATEALRRFIASARLGT